MLKANERDFKRTVEAKLDLSFVRDLVQDCHSSTMGSVKYPFSVFAYLT